MVTTVPNAELSPYRLCEALPYRVYSERPTFFTMLSGVDGKHVLDARARTGEYARQVRRRGAARVVGIDPSDELLTEAKAQEAEEPLGIEYVSGDLAQVGPLGDFDVVIAPHTLHHASTRDELFALCQGIAANLKPGGRLVSICSNPFFDRASYDAQPYGITFSQHAALSDGDDVSATIYGGPSDEPRFEITGHFWSGDTYVAALRTAGVSSITWRLPDVSAAGLQERGPAYWADYLHQPFVIGLEGVRPF